LSLFLAYDIETYRNENCEAYIEAKEYKPDSRLKDPAKIEKNIEDQKAKDYEKAPLFWWLGKIVCISFVDVSFPEKRWSFYGVDEKKLLIDAFTFLEEDKGGYSLIGKSSKDFDKPFTVGRAMYHDIGVPTHFKDNYLQQQDVNNIFGFGASAGQVTSLDNYAWGLQIQGKTSHGGQVEDMYNRASLGDQEAWKEMVTYCEQDAWIVAEMVRRYMKIFDPDQWRKKEECIQDQETEIPF